jgi:hypothetical protein
MRISVTSVLTAASILGLVDQAHAQGAGQERERTSAAVFHQQSFDFGGSITGDLSVQCGAFRDKRPMGLGPEDEAVPFIVYVSMVGGDEFGGQVPTNVRLAYIGGIPAAEVDAVEYASDGALSLTFAAGSDLNFDSVIQVTAQLEPVFCCTNTDGQMSIHLSDSRAKPHPAVDPEGKKFCTTTPVPAS